MAVLATFSTRAKSHLSVWWSFLYKKGILAALKMLLTYSRTIKISSLGKKPQFLSTSTHSQKLIIDRFDQQEHIHANSPQIARFERKKATISIQGRKNQHAHHRLFISWLAKITLVTTSLSTALTCAGTVSIAALETCPLTSMNFALSAASVEMGTAWSGHPNKCCL